MSEKFEGAPQDEADQNQEEKIGHKLDEEIQTFAEMMGVPVENFASQIGNVNIRKINEKFSEQYGFSFSADELPKVFMAPAEIRGKLASTGYLDKLAAANKEIDLIMIKDLGDVASGNILSEELAHFYRCKLGPKEEIEHITNEFFGFLGRRLFEAAAKGSDELSGLEDNKRSVKGKKEVSEMAKEFKAMQRLLEKANNEELSESINELKTARTDMLAHQRGYDWASRIDMGRIKNWRKLFSMPNQEVRRRFFTPNPDYSGL